MHGLRGGLFPSDAIDYQEIAYGWHAVHPGCRGDWVPNPHTGRSEPVKGLFTEENPQQAVKYLRERIHFIGFIHEQDYMESEIAARTAPRYNPHLFASPDAAQNAWNTYPLASPE